MGDRAGYGPGMTVTITNCYSTGDITGVDSGGITGRRTASGATVTITNCYSTGTINADNSGGITGSGSPIDGGTLTISNCYQSGTLTEGGGISGGSTNGTLDIDNCYSQGADSANATPGDGKYIHDGSGSISVDNSGFGNGTWSATLGTDLLDNSTWDDGVSPFRLTHFQSDPWDTATYSTADDETVAYAEGDPHIYPLINPRKETFILPTNDKIFNYFDNNDDEFRIIINVEMWILSNKLIYICERLKQINSPLYRNAYDYIAKHPINNMDNLTAYDTSFMKYIYIKANDEYLIFDTETQEITDGNQNKNIQISSIVNSDMENHDTMRQITISGKNLKINIYKNNRVNDRNGIRLVVKNINEKWDGCMVHLDYLKYAEKINSTKFTEINEKIMTIKEHKRSLKKKLRRDPFWRETYENPVLNYERYFI